MFILFFLASLNENKLNVWPSENPQSKFTKHLTSKATVLEIGSGPGKDLEILSKNPDYKVIGSDNSEEFISYLQNKYSDTILR